MANNIFKLSGILQVAVLTADPSGGAAGSIYYNSTSGTFRMYNGSGWNDTAIGTLSLTGQPLATSDVIVGNGSGNSAAVATSGVGDILADATNGLTIKSGVIVNAEINASAAIDFSKLASLTSGSILVGNGSNVPTAVAMSGDVAIVASGATTIQPAVVSNSKLANMATQTFKGRNTAGTGSPEDLSAATAAAILPAFVGASGGTTAGTKGSVPAPAIGDDTAGKFLKADGTWTTPSSTATTALDGTFVIENSSDNTKKLAFSAAGIATGTTHTITMPNADVDLGNLTNSNISSSAAIAVSKLAAQTASKALASDASGFITPSTTTSTELGYVSGVTSAIQTQLNATEKTANKGAANGYAGLDGGGKVPAAQLPSTLMNFRGAWNASTNSPTLADGTGANGDVWRASVAGTQNLGSGSQTWAVGDFAIYNGTIWQHSPAADGVSSVNGNTGAVTVNAINQLSGDVTTSAASGSQSEAATISAGAVTAAKLGTVTDGVTLDQSGAGGTLEVKTGGIANAQIASAAAIAVNKLAAQTASKALASDASGFITPSTTTSTELGYVSGVTSAIQTQINGKIASVSADTTPSLGGDLNANGHAIYGNLKIAATSGATDFLTEFYMPATTLTGGTTAALTTFASGTYSAMEFTYTIEDTSASPSNMRVGKLRVICNGTAIGLSDDYAETADCGTTWNAAVATGTVTISYTTTASNKTFRASVKQFLA
jgi:hypothetical protein